MEKDAEKVPFQLRLPIKTKEALRRAAFNARVSEAEIVRRALEEYLKKEKK